VTEPEPAEIAYVSAELLEQLVDDLTVEDIRLARADYPEGDPMRGFGAVYFAAKRIGVANGDGPSEFLGRVRLRDLSPIMEKATASMGNAQSGGGISLPSAASGE
jgi:hypothetical protein